MRVAHALAILTLLTPRRDVRETASARATQPGPEAISVVIDYAKLVREYRHGDGSRAIQELLDWKPDAVLLAVHEVEKGQRAGGAYALALTALRSCPAAVMLHTEAGLYLNERGDGAAGWHWLQARRLAELDPFAAEHRTFLQAWYRAFGLFLLGSYAITDALVFFERGLQRFPDDVPTMLARGQAYEARGTFSTGEILSFRTNDSPQAANDLRTAEGIYRNLLAADPSLGEARLRLGRVLQVSGRSQLALIELHRVAAGGEDARRRYLAHLFIAEWLRRESRLSEANQEFTRAVGACPNGQAAALGLAETLHSLGRRTEAAAALAAGLETQGPADPFRSYHFGDRLEHKRLLEAVRDMAKD